MGSHIALVGTEYSSEPMINMAGFLSEMTGAAVENRAIQDGGAFASITTYLTSQEYQQNRPVFLVWENPVYNNLAQFGDQPMKELMATAGNSCRVPIPVMASLDSNRIQADLSTLDPSQNYTLMIETDGVAATAARFTFTSPTGDTRTKSVNRRSAAEASDRFFVPVSGLWREGIRSLEIELNAAFGSSPRISACFN
jgi:alginate biosynthesis protein AlgX